jgi:hypothetical protein
MDPNSFNGTVFDIDVCGFNLVLDVFWWALPISIAIPVKESPVLTIQLGPLLVRKSFRSQN